MGKAKYTFSAVFKNGIQIDNEDRIIINKVIIPCIQRPYVQGRQGEKESRIRKNFLDVIFNKGLKNNEVVDLNFIYGSVVKKGGKYSLELLDGQQRFTTLYLLYWYVLNKEGNTSDDRYKFLESFSYESRVTSKDFCKDLSSHTCELLDTIPSELIRKARWYHNSYEKDPSIGAMLTMLDDIHKQYSSLPINIQYSDRLDNLQFNVLPLPNYDMSEDLYMKMNARGLQLSAFDNFKSQLMGKLETSDISCRKKMYDDKELTFAEVFSIKMDTQWADFFWNVDNNDDYDETYMRFFSRFFAVRYLLSDKVKDAAAFRNDETFSFLYDRSESTTDYLGFEEYDKLLNNAVFFEEIETVLDVLKDNNLIIEEAMTPIWSEEINKNFFCKFCRIGLKDLPIYCAIIDYIIESPICKDGILNKNEFMDYMRVVWNVVGNSDIDNKERLAAVVRAIHQQLIPAVRQTDASFYKALASLKGDEDPSKTYETTRRLLLTEIEKVALIVNDASWRDLFVESEKNPFLMGDVTFFFSENRDTFKHRLDLVSLMFDKGGITQTFREEHLLIRALFTVFDRWENLDKQNITENNEKNYLKNLLTSGKNLECRSLISNFVVSILDKASNLEDMKDLLKEVVNVEFPDISDLRGKEYGLILLRKCLTTDIRMYDWFANVGSPFRIYDFEGHYAIAVRQAYYDRIIPDTDRNRIARKLSDDLKFSLEFKKPKVREYADEYGVEHNFFSSISCEKKYDKITLIADFSSTFNIIIKASEKNKDILESICDGKVIKKEEDTNTYLLYFLENMVYDNIAFYDEEIFKPMSEALARIESVAEKFNLIAEEVVPYQPRKKEKIKKQKNVRIYGNPEDGTPISIDYYLYLDNAPGPMGTITIYLKEDDINILVESIREVPTGEIRDLPANFFENLREIAYDDACHKYQDLDWSACYIVLDKYIPEDLVKILPKEVLNILPLEQFGIYL